MQGLVLEPTAAAQWQALVAQAGKACARPLKEDLESYLVFLLLRFSRRPDLGARPFALAYLEGNQAHGHQRIDCLREVGDQCLLYAGLFPQQAHRRLVRASYFVQLGRGAYRDLSDCLSAGAAEIYSSLSATFVALMEVLQTMREMNGASVLDPLTAADLWTQTGSRHAYEVLQDLTTRDRSGRQ